MKISLERDFFVVEINASNDIIVGVLSIIRDDKKFPVEFYGRILNKTEQRLSTTDKEAFVIILS